MSFIYFDNNLQGMLIKIFFKPDKDTVSQAKITASTTYFKEQCILWCLDVTNNVGDKENKISTFFMNFSCNPINHQ